MPKSSMKLEDSKKIVERALNEQEERINTTNKPGRWKKLSELTYAKTVAKFLSVLLVAIFIFTMLWSTPHSITLETTSNIYDTYVSLAFFVQLLLAVLLSGFLADTYWIDFTSKKAKLDERQIAIRHRIFEKTYLLALTMVLFGVTVGYAIYHDAIIVFGQTKELAAIPIAILMWFLFALPSVVAAWSKEA